jgi:hypothetical protein
MILVFAFLVYNFLLVPLCVMWLFKQICRGQQIHYISPPALVLEDENRISFYKRGNRYNVTLRSLRAAIVAEEIQYILHILSVCMYSYLSYLAYKMHWPYSIFFCVLSSSKIFIGPFRKTAKSDIYFVLFVCLFVCLSIHKEELAPTERISMNFDIWGIFLKSGEKIQVSLKYYTNKAFFTCHMCTVMIISHLTLLSCRENKNSFYVQ